MNSAPTSEESVAENPPSLTAPDRRSYVLEVIGILSAIGFFIGIALAFWTQISGVVTHQEFELLETGQSLTEVNKLLGFKGTLETEMASAAPAHLQTDSADRLSRQRFEGLVNSCRGVYLAK